VGAPLGGAAIHSFHARAKPPVNTIVINAVSDQERSQELRMQHTGDHGRSNNRDRALFGATEANQFRASLAAEFE
jgi:hypothetical protein